MLVGCKDQVIVQLPADSAGDVLIGGLKSLACLQVTLVASVVYEDRYISVFLQPGQFFSGCRKAVCYLKVLQVLLLLPYVDIVCNETCKAYPEAGRVCAYHMGKNLQLS